MKTSDVIDKLPSRDQLLAALGFSTPLSLDDLPSRDQLLAGLGLSKPSSTANVGSAWMLGAGILIGAGLALWFAPRRGAELRTDLGRRGSRPHRGARREGAGKRRAGRPLKHTAP